MAFVAGEELPAFHNHSVWLGFDLRADHEWRWKVWRILTPVLLVRIDLTVDRP